MFERKECLFGNWENWNWLHLQNGVTELNILSASFLTKYPITKHSTSTEIKSCFFEDIKMYIRNLYVQYFYILHKVSVFLLFFLLFFYLIFHYRFVYIFQATKKLCTITKLYTAGNISVFTVVLKVFLKCRVWTWKVSQSWPQLCLAQPCSWSMSPRTDMKNIYGWLVELQHKLSWLSACSPKINFDVSSSKSALIKYWMAHLIWMWINGQSVSSCPLQIAMIWQKDFCNTSFLLSVAFPRPMSVWLQVSSLIFIHLSCL